MAIFVILIYLMVLFGAAYEFCFDTMETWVAAFQKMRLFMRQFSW